MATVEDAVFRQETRDRPGKNTRLAAPPQAALNRQAIGAGQHVQTSLAVAATLLQSPYLQIYDGKVWDEPSGPRALGWGPLQRPYRASDGWLFLGATDSQRSRLDAVPVLSASRACAAPA